MPEIVMNRFVLLKSMRSCGFGLIFACGVFSFASAQQVVKIGQTEFTVADGWTLESAATEPLVRYP
ncbi:MAG TPA: hypothetical protein DDZ51_03165, partial [Planctomycetaceae bacterium]|nr:hypothetical protein [Planctomycetaceae bacterium]